MNVYKTYKNRTRTKSNWDNPLPDKLAKAAKAYLASNEPENTEELVIPGYHDEDECRDNYVLRYYSEYDVYDVDDFCEAIQDFFQESPFSSLMSETERGDDLVISEIPARGFFNSNYPNYGKSLYRLTVCGRGTFLTKDFTELKELCKLIPEFFPSIYET